MQIMMDVAASGKMIPFSDNLITALLGYAVVFAGLYPGLERILLNSFRSTLARL